MEITTINQRPVPVANGSAKTERADLKSGTQVDSSTYMVRGIERAWVDLQVSLTILALALKCYGSWSGAIKAIKELFRFRNTVYGRDKKWRYFKVDGKYHFGIYFPTFPSARFNDFIRTEFYKHLPHHQPANRFQSAYLAITNKCPLQCEHCFEWHNLNQPETFSMDELKKIIAVLQQEGCTQIHFTGGEPVVRMKKLEELVRYASPKSECWILTSGINLTPENAIRLKKAGATGVIISLDHYDPILHNRFRGSEQSFDWVMKAVQAAHGAKLVTAFSICLTRSFCTDDHLMAYANLAKACGVSYVQFLEPKAVGHYENQAVALSSEEFERVSQFYLKLNFSAAFRDYPVFIFHGYYQRKMGCYSGGDRSLYIDSAGHINACTFCHTHQYEAHDLLTDKLKINQIHLGGCPAFKNVSVN